MVNARAIGWRSRKKCIDQLTEDGWVVDTVEKTSKFAKQKDMFGLFDLCCVKSGEKVKFVQVTTTRPHSHAPFSSFINDNNNLHFEVEQWVWIRREGWKIFIYNEEGYISVRDNGQAD